MKKINILILLIIFVTSSYALSEGINPFGISLVSEFDKKYLYKSFTFHKQSWCTFIDPPIKNSNFKNYRACVTPISQTVYNVSAQGFNFPVNCYPIMWDFAEILSKKYNLKYLALSMEYIEEVVLKGKDLNIILNCFENLTRDYHFAITYKLISKEIKSLIEEEKLLSIEKRINKTDQKGL